MSSTHSTGQVMLTIYNLPPWLCMKRKLLMMSLLISGPRQSKNDIDVYLTPIIEDLKIMWEEGVEVFDAYHQEFFTLRVILLWTINIFSAYSNLSVYIMKGHKACSICAENTFSDQLRHARKIIYLGTWRFLPVSHNYRRLRKAFNRSIEEERASKVLNDEQVYERVKHLMPSCGKVKQNIIEKNVWKKRSIFFNLLYWKCLFVRHYIDVMYIEKNVW